MRYKYVPAPKAAAPHPASDRDTTLRADFRPEAAGKPDRSRIDPRIHQICEGVRTALADGDFEAAERLIPQIVQIDSHQYDRIENRLCLQILTAKVNAGIEVDMEGIKNYIADLSTEYPGDGKIHFAIGHFYRATGKYAEALKCYEVAEIDMEAGKMSRCQKKQLQAIMAECRSRIANTPQTTVSTQEL